MHLEVVDLDQFLLQLAEVVNNFCDLSVDILLHLILRVPVKGCFGIELIDIPLIETLLQQRLDG